VKPWPGINKNAFASVQRQYVEVNQTITTAILQAVKANWNLFLNLLNCVHGPWCLHVLHVFRNAVPICGSVQHVTTVFQCASAMRCRLLAMPTCS